MTSFRMISRVLVWTCAISACGSVSGRANHDNESPSEPAIVASDRRTTETSVERETGHAPVLRVQARVDASGGIALVVENHGRERARISSRVTAERANARGGFEATAEIDSFALRPDCEHRAEDCIELAPGGALYPPGWEANGQCGSCADCAALRPGTYRVIVTSCGGAHRIASEPFTIGG